jgi:putative redox protein
MKITTRYEGGMRFAGGDGVARVVMDGLPEAGGRGEAKSPKQLVLEGLAGCTGMDVASTLGRKGVAFESLSIDVEAEQTTPHPRVFTTIHITFRVKADPSARGQIERAISQSQEKFCGVSAMLGKTATVTWSLELEPSR